MSQGIGFRCGKRRMGDNYSMPHEKYARIERERRFLLARFPSEFQVLRQRRIADRYIEGTTLRLLESTYDDCLVTFKLSQKIPMRANGAQQGYITSMYVTQDEFRVLAQLPARTLTKTRYSVPPFGIDVFEGELEGLILAEIEFDSAEAAEGFVIPSFALAEVTVDERFTGGRLAGASREDIYRNLLQYGVPVRSC